MEKEFEKCPKCGDDSYGKNARQDMEHIGSKDAEGNINWAPAPDLEGFCNKCGCSKFASNNQPAFEFIVVGNKIFA